MAAGGVLSAGGLDKRREGAGEKAGELVSGMEGVADVCGLFQPVLPAPGM